MVLFPSSGLFARLVSVTGQRVLIRVDVQGHELDVEMDLDWVVAASPKRGDLNAAKVILQGTDQKAKGIHFPIRAIADSIPQLGSDDADTERRSHILFPLQLQCRYERLGRGQLFAGKGWVKNMSLSGVLISCKPEMSLGTRIQLTIDWPCPLHGRIPPQLVSAGRLVRHDVSGFAVAMARYQFRTRKRLGSIAAVFSGKGGPIG